MNDIYAAIAKVWPAIAEAEKREAEQLRRWVMETAIDAKGSDEVSAKDKEHVDFWLEEFEACFDCIATMKGDNTTAALGVLEAAIIIFSIAPPGGAAKQRISDAGFHSKGGRARAKMRRRDRWNLWGRDVMKETKALIRKKPRIKRVTVLQHLRDDLNPSCSDRTLETTIDRWNKRAQRLIRQRRN